MFSSSDATQLSLNDPEAIIVQWTKSLDSADQLLDTHIADYSVNWYKDPFLAKMETFQKGPLILTKQTLAANADCQVRLRCIHLAFGIC